MVLLYRTMSSKTACLTVSPDSLVTKRIVVVGGGTGTSVVLSALKHVPRLKLSAIVVVSDNGGSTRRLRDEFGFLPVGDLRQCLAALADGKNQAAVRELLLYRFQKGSGLTGHNLGNLILTALEDLYPSPAAAIETATKIFRVNGEVLPVTEAIVQLKITYANGQELIGEEHLDDPKLGGQTIAQIALTPSAKLYAKAKAALQKADQIILGPGDLYGSLLPNTLPLGFTQTLQKTSAKFCYIVNLMTHYSQTHNFTASDHVAAITKYCGRSPDLVIVNTGTIPQTILRAYAKQHEFPVVNDLASWIKTQPQTKIVTGDFVSKITVPVTPGDTLVRSLLRHDGDKLAEVLLNS